MGPDKFILFEKINELAPLIVTIVTISIGGWVLTMWLRIKHGYPLDGAWGQALHPRNDKEAMERIKLLTNENAQLRAEIGSMKDRLETVERIVTDQPSRLAREIDQLAIDKGGHA
jgi:predicted metal-binding membrane protein